MNVAATFHRPSHSRADHPYENRNAHADIRGLLIDLETLSAPFADDGGGPLAMDPETTSSQQKNESILVGLLKIRKGPLGKKSNFLARG